MTINSCNGASSWQKLLRDSVQPTILDIRQDSSGRALTVKNLMEQQIVANCIVIRD